MLPSAALPAEATLKALQRVALTWGTPCYAYDLARLRSQLDGLRGSLPASIDIQYSLKANPAVGLGKVIAERGFGADVVSVGELAAALEAGFTAKRIFVSGPYKSPEMLASLRLLPEALLSVDSMSELKSLAEGPQENRLVLRLRPDFTPSALMTTGPGSRFGIPIEDLASCGQCARRLVGFHVFAGSQVLDAGAAVEHLRRGLDLSLRAADLLGIQPEIFNLGGGFGIPYGPGEPELDLVPIAEELERLAARVAPARIVIELGRYMVAQCGWYLTQVVAQQSHRGRRAVVVNGGVHQRADLCGIDLRRKSAPPQPLQPGRGPIAPTDVLGCLCLPDDVLVEASPLPGVDSGDFLAFPNAGAYGLSASPVLFLSHPPPLEVTFDGLEMELLRTQPANGCLQNVQAACSLHAGLLQGELHGFDPVESRRDSE
jgi:diaminopimelate decarboxylase